MKKIILLSLICLNISISAQNNQPKAIPNTAKEIVGTKLYKEWKIKFVTKIKRGNLLMNNAKQIRKKYVYTNIIGERVFSENSFSSIDKQNYRKTLNQLGDLLSSVTNLKYDYDSDFENIYYMEMNDEKKSIELFKISQFYNDSF